MSTTAEPNLGARCGREREYPDDVGSGLGSRECQPRVQLDIVMILGENDALWRHHLQDGIDGGTKSGVGIDGCDQRLTGFQRDSEAVHVATIENAVDGDVRIRNCLGGFRPVVWLLLVDLLQVANQERDGRGRPLGVVEANPDAVSSQIPGNENLELP